VNTKEKDVAITLLPMYELWTMTDKALALSKNGFIGSRLRGAYR
jgi:hypothetical protein